MRSEVIVLAKKFVRRPSLRRLTDFVVRTMVSHHITVEHGDLTIRLSHPNPQIRSRNHTFSTKEPATLRWIEAMGSNAVLWDVGANVGLYSVFAARRGVEVVAIEPSALNCEFLVRNITLNDVSKNVLVVPLALGSRATQVAPMNLKSSAWGDSQNAYATNRGQSGEVEIFEISYRTLGLSLDSLASQFGIPIPTHIKIDVDGIEPEILDGGSKVLRSVKSVLVEVPLIDGSSERIAGALRDGGLRLQDVEDRNQIWVRGG